MRKNLIFAAAAAAAILSGCAKEVLTDNSSENVLAPEDAIRFTATVEEAVSTKGVLEDKLFKWEVGDEISVSDGTAQAIYAVSEVSEDNVATFLKKEGEADLAAGATYEAWYPASLADGAIPYDQVLVTTDTKNANSTEGAYKANPMHAAETSGSVLEFKNLCGMVHFHMTSPTESKVALKSITVTADKALSGVFTLDGDKAVVMDGGNCSARCNAQNAKWLNTVHEFYLALPEGEYSKFDILLTANNGMSKKQTLKSGKTVVITRNVMNEISLTMEDIWDLSKDGTANSYIACSNVGSYRFLPTKGCSSESVGSIASVKVVWESAVASSSSPETGAIVNTVSYDSSTGYIGFKRGGSQGNAIIAACDASGVILWSWHIWGINNLPTDQTYPNGKQYMNCNLGAFANTWTKSGEYYNSMNAVGLMYQWGRKDPFPGRGNRGNSVSALNPAKPSPSTTAATSVAEAYANPAVFYASSAGVWSSELTTWDGDTKSIHDPCPPGYRVWDNAAWGSTVVKADFSTNPMNSGADNLIYNMGFSYKLGSDTAFYATNGQYSNSAGTFGSGLNQYRSWHRTVSGGKTGFYNLTQSGSGTSIVVNTASVTMNIPQGSSYGMGVRCERVTE